LNKNIACLLIEDDQDDQEIFAMALQEVGYNVACTMASSAIDALSIIENEPYPDYIFMDVNMPKMNGIECLTKFRELGVVDNTRVFMISTSADKRLVEQCRALGAADFIVKPNTIGELVTALRDIFTTKR
jgi:CheY-like chemotaxis protein